MTETPKWQPEKVEAPRHNEAHGRMAEMIHAKQVFSPKKTPVGKDVAQLQYWCKGLNIYDGPITGKYADLRASIIQFQKNAKIGIDGAVGPQTLTSLHLKAKEMPDAPIYDFETAYELAVMNMSNTEKLPLADRADKQAILTSMTGEEVKDLLYGLGNGSRRRGAAALQKLTHDIQDVLVDRGTIEARLKTKLKTLADDSNMMNAWEVRNMERAEKEQYAIQTMVGVTQHESDGRQFAVSGAGALGLCQHMPMWFTGNNDANIGPYNPFNQDEQIDAMVDIFEYTLGKPYRKSWNAAMTAYNVGGPNFMKGIRAAQAAEGSSSNWKRYITSSAGRYYTKGVRRDAKRLYGDKNLT